MKATRPSSALLPILLLAAAPLAAETSSPVLIADLAPGGVAAGFYPTELAAAGGHLYMSFEQSLYGLEPWISDGTAAGTRRLADLCPGACSSFPSGFATAGDRVVFATSEAGHRAIRSVASGGAVDLIADGLELIGDFQPLGDLVYFAARRAGQIPRLYRSDGKTAGTRPAAELCGEGAASCETSFPLQADGDRLYYHQDGVFYLYTAAGGRRPLATLAGARSLTPFGDGRLIFEGCAAAPPADCRVYTTDGTAAGTSALSFFGSGGDNFVAFGDRAYFRDDTRKVFSTDGRQPEARSESSFGSPVELHGTTASDLIYSKGNFGEVELHARAASGADTVLRTGLTDVAASGRTASHFFFAYLRDEWIGFAATDGSPAGTFEMAERERGGIVLPPPGSELEGGETATLGGRFYFSFEPGSPQLPARLWSSDGTPAGTGPIDFGPGAGFSSFPTAYRHGRTILLDSANDTTFRRVDPETLAFHPLPSSYRLETIAGAFAYFRDYGPLATSLLAVAEDDTATNLAPPGIGIGEMAAAEDGLIYFADGESRVRLWESDGTTAGTRLLFDLESICAVCARHLPAHIAPSGDQVFFVGEGAGINQFALWSWRRGAVAPVSLMPLPGNLELIPAGDGRVVFITPIPFSGGERFDLWVSDGTPAGTRIVFQLPHAALMEHWAVAGSRFYFSIDSYLDAVPASSLWVSDLTPGGSVQLIAAAGSFTELAATGESLYFAGRSAAGVEPGFSDGTPAGTRWLDLQPGAQGSGASDLYVLADGRLVFSAAADAAGAELWISDGTLAGSQRLTDLAPGPEASSPGGFAEMPGEQGSRLFFAATDGQVGREPWALDLPPDRPTCPNDRLCLRDGRFEVTAEAEVNGVRHPASRVLASAESGVFSFFSADNWELQVKVLDGCAINDSFWVYAAAATDVAYRLSVHDRWSGATRDYASAGLSRPILDSAAFAACGAAELPPAYSPAPAGPAAHRCSGEPGKLCLGPQGRYRVAMSWTTAEDEGTAAPVPNGSEDSGLFTFFSPDNWEAMVKVLDGCAINGKIWVFAAGTTDVGWTLTVEDRTGGVSRAYENPLGQPSRTVADTAAFDCN